MVKESDGIREKLRAGFRWRSDPWESGAAADSSSWWRDAEIIAGLGRAVADLNPAASSAATVVMGTESHGFALAVLVAQHLGVGVAPVRKEPERASNDDRWFTQVTPPDYRDRHLELAVRRTCLRQADRVLFVDDWIDTGAQALACRKLVAQAGAQWLGVHVIVDALEESATRRELALARLLHLRELSP